MSINSIKKFYKTENAAEYFSISTDILKSGKRDGTFVLGLHFVQPRMQLLRWNIEELENWFYCNKIVVERKNSILVDNLLK